MPLIELLDHSGHLAAPGACQWWQFSALDQNQRIRLDIQFHHGFAFHPEYARRYRAYRRRPTINRPPTPAEYPCVRYSVYENEKCLASAILQYPPNSLHSEQSGKEIRIGDNRLSLDRELVVQFVDEKLPVWGKLNFRPISVYDNFQALSAPHHWLLARPLCDVTGQIRVGGRQIELAGLGCHDCSFGPSPLVSGLARWGRGRALMPRTSIAFQVTTAESSGQHSATVVICDETGIQKLRDLKFTINEEKHTAWGLRYPSSINFGERLLLRGPRVIESSTASLNLIFDAYLDGEQSQAVIEVVYPKKLTQIFAGFRSARAIRLIEST